VNSRLTDLLENRPHLAWFGSLGPIAAGWWTWFVEHVDSVAKLIGFVAVLFGAIAGYYTMRIQRRAWRKDTTRRLD
jgi:hypothetical protein